MESLNSVLVALKEKFDELKLLLICTAVIPDNFDAKHCNLVPLSKTVEFINLLHSHEIKDKTAKYKEDDANKLLGLKSVHDEIEKLIDSGVSPSKIVVGIHFSGPIFRTISESMHEFENMKTFNDVCRSKVKWEIFFGESELTVL